MASPSIDLAGIVPESITDGPGLRLTIFCQGCPHHCEGCHNPETWDFAGGTSTPVDAIFQQVKANPLLRGVTFSGGEPFSQAGAFAALARLLKDAGYEIAVYSGYTFEELYKDTRPEIWELLSLCHILVDGPFVLAQRDITLPFRGSANQRILDLPASMAAGHAVLCTASRWTGEWM